MFTILEEILKWEYDHVAFLLFIRRVIASAIVLAIGILLSRGFKKLLNKTAVEKLHIDNTVSSILRYIVSYGVYIICIIMVLNIFGVNTASLIAVLGAAGLAIGLALRDTLSNIAAGFILFFLGSFRLGEFIEFGSINGTVREINLFTTILETPDGIYISAPNSSIWGTPLRNFTRNGKRRMELTIGISFSDKIETAFEVLNGIISAESRFLKDPAPQIIVQSIQESSIIICLRAWANINEYWDVYWYQMRNLKEKIEEAGLKIPFPQRDIHIYTEPAPAAPPATVMPDLTKLFINNNNC